MSVATAGAAVSTQQHQQQPTQEQIRLAQLIDDKKHNQPEVQEIVRKVLDVVEDSNQEDALVALYDCDYDCEKAVALLIEKGNEVRSEWRTATNHKLTKKQQEQQQKVAAIKNGHEEVNENGQQRGTNTSNSRGKSRSGRSRFQQNGGDSQNMHNQQQSQANDNDIPQYRQRGGNGYRGGRNRGYNRGGFRGTDRNYQQQQQQQTQDSNIDTLSSSDTNRRSRGAANASGEPQQQQQPPQQESWDVGNWNGETLIISRTTKDDEPPINSDDSSAVQNGQSDVANQDKSKSEFDPVEAARQIKNVIGIGQVPKPFISDQQQKSKPSGQPINTKVTPPPRIPQQPVIFSDHFDGGMNKIDVQFGNLGESFDDTTTSSAFYQPTESIPSNKVSQRATEQSSHISSATRPSEQPVMNQQRILLTQMQQSSMTIKPVVTSQYAIHQQQQHPANTQNMVLQSLLLHQQQQPEPVTLDSSYDPTAFSLPSIEFNSPYFLPPAMNQPLPPPPQQTQQRYLVSQPPPPPQQTTTKPAQTPSVPTSTSSTATKKAPVVPPGMFPPTTAPPLTQAAFTTAYGVQQQTGGPTYSAPYDTERLFSNVFMPLTNVQQAQSPSGGYGSVTPPVQQQNQQQQVNNNNDNKNMNYRAPITENLMLLQQYQQFALQQSNSQQHGQQAAAHSPAGLNYFLGHPPSGSNYSPGPQIMYAQAATAMAQQQQQVPKQQGQQYNQNNSSTGMGGNDDYYGRGSSSSNKEGQYMYTTPNQSQHVPPQSTGQQQGVNKQQQQQQQQRPSGNVYNNQQGQQRPFQ